MEQYKEKLKIQNIITAVCCVVLALVSLLGFAAEMGLVELTPVTGDSHWQSQWRGFLSGASMGVLGCMVFYLIRSIRALKDEKKLKALYIKENDERMIQIVTAAKASAMQTSLLVGLAACIVAGYFSMAVSITILACTLALALVGAGFKIYYSRKF